MPTVELFYKMHRGISKEHINSLLLGHGAAVFTINVLLTGVVSKKDNFLIKRWCFKTQNNDDRT